MRNWKEVRGSECCGAEVSEIRERIVKTSPGVTSYYRCKCTSCGKPCHTCLLRLFDSDGAEVLPGHILLDDEKFYRPYHAVIQSPWHKGLEIRDLSANNVEMWGDGEWIKTLGPYWRNLDQLDDDDLGYYFHTTRAEAERTLAKEVEK